MRARKCFAWAIWMGWCPMARAFPSRRGAADYRGSLFDAEDVRKTVARLTAEGRVSRVVVLIETLDPRISRGCFAQGRPRLSLRVAYAATGAQARERLITTGV